MVVWSADLDDFGGGFCAEGLLDLFDVGFVIVCLGREIFFEQEVVPDRAVRVEHPELYNGRGHKEISGHGAF